MKKKYEKPIFVFEPFSLNTNIAGDCELKTSLPSKGVCGYETRGGIVFTDANSGCNYTSPITEEDMYNGFCYHVPTEEKNLFNS